MTQTLDPTHVGTGNTLSGGNLIMTSDPNTSFVAGAWATVGKSSGKWYWEIEATTIGSGAHYYGIASGASGPNHVWSPGEDTNGIEYGSGDLSITWNNTSVQLGLTGYIQGDVIGIQWDADNDTIQWSRNGTLQGTPVDISSGGASPVPKPTFPAISLVTTAASNVVTMRFAQSSWTGTPSAGFGPFDVIDNTVLMGQACF